MIFVKMAAPLRSTILNKQFRKPVILCLSHLKNYSRDIRQPVVNILDSKEEASKLKKRNIVRKDPRLEVDFDPRDPVKRNLPQNDKKFDKKRSLPKNEQNSDKDLQNTKTSKSKKVSTEKRTVSESRANNRKKGTYQDIEYEFLGDDKDGIFGKAVMKARSKGNKEKKNKDIILEGKRLILDALNAGGTMQELYFSGKETLKDVPALSVPVYKVSYNNMKIWSDTETPAGLLAIFRRPKEGVALCGPENPLPVTLIMDQIRDPGNMGTLIRSAAAVGCQRILAVKGCVDVWESKVLRAGAGSHFRVPIISNLPWESIPGYISKSTDVLVADLHRPTQKRVENVGKSSVDNESLEELFDAQDRKEKGESDSDGETENESDGETENESDSESDTEKEKSIDDSYKDNDFLQKYENAPLPVKFYHNVEYSNNKPKVLIIGGESSGVSLQARKLVFDNSGTVVTIPMCAGVDSLNTSIAGSIILYEMFKHLNKTDS